MATKKKFRIVETNTYDVEIDAEDIKYVDDIEAEVCILASESGQMTFPQDEEVEVSEVFDDKLSSNEDYDKLTEEKKAEDK